MNKEQAIELLTQSLPFGAEGEDYQTTFNDTVLSSVEELIEHLENDFGEFTIDAYSSETNEIGLVYIESSGSETLYQAPAPTGLTLKLMEALYILTP